MSTVTHAIAYDELQRIRETTSERVELIRGEIVLTPSPSPLHQRVTRRLNHLLEHLVIESGIGEFYSAPLDVRLSAGNVIQPDILVVLNDRAGIVADPAIEGAPNFVVEVLSPSTKGDDLVRKLELYAEYGVQEYWIVDPDARTITLLSEPKNAGYQSRQIARDFATSKTIPGLIVDLTALFAPRP